MSKRHLPVVQEKEEEEEIKQLSFPFVDSNILATGKFHVSYSEIMVHAGDFGCPFKHKLTYVDGYRDLGNEHTLYGQLVHEIIETWLNKRNDPTFSFNEYYSERLGIFEQWMAENRPRVEEEDVIDRWITPFESIFIDLLEFLNNSIPEFEVYGTEIPLFESIAGFKDRYFKGFIDSVISYEPHRLPPGSPLYKPNSVKQVGKEYLLVDWKTSASGWTKKQKADVNKIYQLALYKHYFSKLTGIEFDKIKTGFMVLMREPSNSSKKPSKNVEFVNVEINEKVCADALEKVRSSTRQIEKKLWIKNKNSCRFCEFKNTKLCP